MAGSSDKEIQYSSPEVVTCFNRVVYNNTLVNNAEEGGIKEKFTALFSRLPEDIKIITVSNSYLDRQESICQDSDTCPLSGLCNGRVVVPLGTKTHEESGGNKETFFRAKLRE